MGWVELGCFMRYVWEPGVHVGRNTFMWEEFFTRFRICGRRPGSNLRGTRVKGGSTVLEDHCTACTARLKTTVLRLVAQNVCLSLL